MGHILMVNDASASTRLVRCPQCTDWLKHSRLTEEERRHRVSDLVDRMEDKRGEMYALRFMARQVLADPYGFLTVWGHKGGGKSLLLTALVAEFCLMGRSAMYYNINEVVEKINPARYSDVDGIKNVEGSPSTFMQTLKDVRVLALDELDKIKWSSWQIQQIGEVIEWRHRHAATHVTLLAMNKHPEQWLNAPETGHIASRFNDGSFYRLWPAEHTDDVPACAVRDAKGRFEIPGIFEVTLPDMRPTLRRY